MKIALIADIHANHYALEAVLNAATAAEVDRILVAGDLVGYYFAPSTVLDLLSAWEWISVRGNHEEMLAKARTDKAYLEILEARYGSGLRVAIEQLSELQLDNLCNLPHPLELDIDGRQILLSHGAPWDIDEYVYPSSDKDFLSGRLAKKYDLIVMGHTHYPMVKHIGDTIVVNPGSVGQPRDREPGACWALYDTEDDTIQCFRQRYDYWNLLHECQQRHPELPYLAEVLKRQ